MSASAAPPISAEERAQSLRELRPMARGKYSRYTRQLISGVISGIEHDLEEDAAELRKLASLAGTDVVQQLLCKQVESIEAVLRVASAHTDDGAVADDEGDGATAQDEKGAAAPPPEQKAPPKAAPTPAAASTASPKPAATDTPLEAELDPARWPLATDADLTVECWRSSHEPHRQIPRCKYGSKAARQLMEQRKPVVLTHAPLVASAAGKWDLAFLRRNLRGVPCTVYTSQTRHFRYWDEQKNDAGYSLSESGRTQKETMGIEDFCERVGLSVEGAPASDSPALRYYLQSALVDGVGDELMAHFRAFDWEALLGLQRKLGWGELTSNLLLVGQRGNTTPAHYDEQQNLFAQLHGKKRVVLFSPADFRCLYPFPLHHPCDRQAQVDLYAPDMQRFPRFTAARPLEAVLEPGEVLYIPQYWWHHIENLSDGCTSLNFWFKDQEKPQKVVLPLSPTQHLAMRRNVEKLVGAKLGAARAQEALPLLVAAKPPPDVAELHEEVRRLLSQVLPEGHVDSWLEELVDGRFSIWGGPDAGKVV